MTFNLNSNASKQGSQNRNRKQVYLPLSLTQKPLQEKGKGTTFFTPNTQAQWIELTSWITDRISDGSITVGGADGNGIISALPIGTVSIATQGALEITGNTGAATVTGGGTRFAWIPAKAALRAGDVSGAQWDNASVGTGSTALGRNNTAAGDFSFAIGSGSTASNINSFAGGENSTASGDYAIAWGQNNNATALHAIALGFECTASGAYSMAAGWTNTTSGDYGLTLGGYSNTNSSYGAIVMGSENNVASGSRSAVVLGEDHDVSGTSEYATIGGGLSNNIQNSLYAVISGGYDIDLTSSSTYGTVSGGYSHTMSNSIAGTISGGYDHDMTSSNYATIGGGSANSIDTNSHYSTIAGGVACSISGATHSFIGGGDNNDIRSGANYSVIIGGQGGEADRPYQTTLSAYATTSVKNQSIVLQGRVTTSDTTPTLVNFGTGVTNIPVSSNTILGGTINIVASGGQTAHYMRKFLVRNVGGTTSLVGTVTSVGTDHESDPAMDVSVTANDTNDSLEVTVTGTNTTTYWSVTVYATESRD